jgi:hypothetical protein
MKNKLKSLIDWNWDKIANVSVVIGVFIAIITFCNSNKQFKESLKISNQLFKKDSILLAKQIELSQEPIVRILPENQVEGLVANFSLQIKNYSMSDLVDIRIFTDYFIAISKGKEEISLISFGTTSSQPNHKISDLTANELKVFNIEFNTTLEQMNEYYNSDFKGQRMKLVRLIIEYERKVDGKRFIYKKAYIIAGHGDYLIDSDERGIRPPLDLFNFDDIKRIIGTND